MPNVSVIIPTYNRLNQLKQVLAGFDSQSCDMNDVEIIVISDGSTDDTDRYLRETYVTGANPGAISPSGVNPRLNLIHLVQENAGPAAARNLGIVNAQGELILFVDDDVVPDSTLISEHLRIHKEEAKVDEDAGEETGEPVVVLGPMLTPANYEMTPWVQWEQRMLYKQYADMEAGKWEPTARQFYTGNASLRREHLVGLGGFDVSFRRAEDVELAYRLAESGMRFIFNPKAIGYHYVNRSFASWLQTPYLYGKNDVIFSQSKGQSWLIPTIMREFHDRHQVIKSLVRVCLSQSLLSKAAMIALEQMARLGHSLAKVISVGDSLSRFAYSGIYNLTYYQGVADELGGRQRFFGLVDKAVPQLYHSQGLEPGVS